ncbi:hypothetical protein L218DRAFT_957374 [Marasmius fiardii PR-910]|nr:hypothetical protein L218DRAFT_957374 [Marasmius fiardii PR-910]
MHNSSRRSSALAWRLFRLLDAARGRFIYSGWSMLNVGERKAFKVREENLIPAMILRARKITIENRSRGCLS